LHDNFESFGHILQTQKVRLGVNGNPCHLCMANIAILKEHNVLQSIF